MYIRLDQRRRLDRHIEHRRIAFFYFSSLNGPKKAQATDLSGFRILELLASQLYSSPLHSQMYDLVASR